MQISLNYNLPIQVQWSEIAEIINKSPTPALAAQIKVISCDGSPFSKMKEKDAQNSTVNFHNEFLEKIAILGKIINH